MSALFNWSNNRSLEWHVYVIIDPLADNKPLVGRPGQENTVADNLEDWLWQHYSGLTQGWLKTNDDLRTSLHKHYQRQQAETIPLLW